MARQRTIIITALIISLVLYGTGVLSGIFATNLIEERNQEALAEIQSETQQNLLALQNNTQQQIDSLEAYVTFLQSNIESMQFEQIFGDTLSTEERCQFSDIALRDLFDQIYEYRVNLPLRLEEYELSPELSDFYVVLRNDYAKASIRAWILAKNQHDICESDSVPALYFYSQECSDCVRQGEILDTVQQSFYNGKRIVVFTISIDADDPTVSHLAEFYSIKSTPAVVVNDVVFRGVTRAKEFDEALS